MTRLVTQSLRQPDLLARYGAEGISADLALRTYSARLLGADPDLVLHGGGNSDEI